jgi:hypothetical protein
MTRAPFLGFNAWARLNDESEWRVQPPLMTKVAAYFRPAMANIDRLNWFRKRRAPIGGHSTLGGGMIGLSIFMAHAPVTTL